MLYLTRLLKVLLLFALFAGGDVYTQWSRAQDWGYTLTFQMYSQGVVRRVTNSKDEFVHWLKNPSDYGGGKAGEFKAVDSGSTDSPMVSAGKKVKGWLSSFSSGGDAKPAAQADDSTTKKPSGLLSMFGGGGDNKPSTATKRASSGGGGGTKVQIISRSGSCGGTAFCRVGNN